MFFTKFPHPANCSFAESYDPATSTLSINGVPYAVLQDEFEGSVHRLRIQNPDRWSPRTPLIELIVGKAIAAGEMSISESFHLELADSTGKRLLESAELSFGVSGETWMFCFDVSSEARFFGMGEKNFGRMELSGIRTKFWNTDVWSDFHFGQWKEFPTDPPYLSVPYLIVKDKGGYVGILVNSGYPAFFETPGMDEDRVFVEWQRTNRNLIVGAEGGEPELWLIQAPDLKSLTQKFQKLVGVTPLPPLWSLGYHQSRWGYAGEKDLMSLHATFKDEDIPCDALWLDIDYMSGYRVFTVESDHFPNGTQGAFGELLKENRRVVAILDPGVKFEKGFSVYDSGHKGGSFCLNREGKEFIGLVWPGETVFPDFNLAHVRSWWASQVADLRKAGFGAFWIDMNDPSTGPVDPTDMLFHKGTVPHAAHRNDYALGMQMATFQGMLEFNSNERPFVLSRSGSTGTSRYSAVWTGDNLSNYFYLQMAIPTSLNLSLSGIPFNGPDIGGFGGDCSEELMLDWMKACFLFPFTRNHTGLGTRFQEPWAYSQGAKETLAKYLKLRYKLLPYLYNLFAEQEEVGDPILRPLIYEFDGSFEQVVDQFMVGPYILQAPIIKAKAKGRKLILPGKEPWFDASTGSWKKSGSARALASNANTPLFIRNGAIIPTCLSHSSCEPVNLKSVEFHVFAAPGTTGSNSVMYRADDGISFDYKKGMRSCLEISLEWDETSINVSVNTTSRGFGEIDRTFIFHVGERECKLNGMPLALNSVDIALSGEPFLARTDLSAERIGSKFASGKGELR